MITALIVVGSIITYLLIMTACLVTTRVMENRRENKSFYDDWSPWYLCDILWPLWAIVGPGYGIILGLYHLVMWAGDRVDSIASKVSK